MDIVVLLALKMRMMIGRSFWKVFHWHTLRNSGRLANPARICCRLGFFAEVMPSCRSEKLDSFVLAAGSCCGRLAMDDLKNRLLQPIVMVSHWLFRPVLGKHHDVLLSFSSSAVGILIVFFSQERRPPLDPVWDEGSSRVWAIEALTYFGSPKNRHASTCHASTHLQIIQTRRFKIGYGSIPIDTF